MLIAWERNQNLECTLTPGVQRWLLFWPLSRVRGASVNAVARSANRAGSLRGFLESSWLRLGTWTHLGLIQCTITLKQQLHRSQGFASFLGPESLRDMLAFNHENPSNVSRNHEALRAKGNSWDSNLWKIRHEQHAMTPWAKQHGKRAFTLLSIESWCTLFCQSVSFKQLFEYHYLACVQTAILH